MQFQHVPSIGPRYWIAITLASVLGANLGDFCSHILGLGHVCGLPVLALVFTATIVAERLARRTTEVFYWAAIVILRTAATNLADSATHDLRLSYVLCILVLAAVLGALITILARQPRRPADNDIPNTTGLYWVTMLTAGTLGTAMGDFCADQTGLAASTFVWAAIWAAVLLCMVQLPLKRVRWYWLAIVVIRTFGTNAGDLIAGRHGLALGLPISTALSAAALVILLLAWRPARSAGAVPP